MADTPSTTVPSDPNKPGKETSEFSLSRLAMILAAVLAALITFFTQLNAALPDNRWIPGVLAVLGAIAGMVVLVAKYSVGRSDVKVEQIAQAGAEKVAILQLEAAKTMADAGVAQFATGRTNPPSP